MEAVLLVGLDVLVAVMGNMKILIVGKKPPLQGGTALDTWRFARDMVSRGHEVFYLSNAGDASNNYKMWYSADDKKQFDNLSNGINFIESSVLKRGSYIPFSSAAETRLFGAAIEQAQNADVIVGWYMQPYGVVGALLAAAFNKPLYLVHAGSDLGRLAKHPDLNNTYHWAISRGTLITPNENIAEIISQTFIELPHSSVKVVPRGRCLENWHKRKGEEFNFQEHSSALAEWYDEYPKVKELLFRLKHLCFSPPADATIITIYGKIGDSKGTFSLLDAFKNLIADGDRNIYLTLTLAGHMGQVIKVLERLKSDHQLAERVILLPFIAPWKISSLIRQSSIVCFLEHNFEVSFHSPSIPKEVLNIGTCLVCSKEVWKKYSKFIHLSNGIHLHVIDNPLDGTELHDLLASIIEKNDIEKVGVSGLSASLGHNSQIRNTDLLCKIIETA
ncbi:MAG: glycosyltransferase [Thalassotalea sp.]